MVEEFHGAGWNDGNGPFKLLYGWNSINTNVWMPSLSELVGYDPNQYWETNGCYFSAMQGMNTSTAYWTDKNGGEQFAYFKRYNTVGGGGAIWNACKNEQTWLRSPDLGRSTTAWCTIDSATIFIPDITTAHAVHPAV